VAPIRIMQTQESHFPDALLMQAITTGEAWVMVSIDLDGRLTDALVTRYTHRALADEALSVLREARITPATRDGQPLAACSEVHFVFNARGAVITMDARASVASLTAFVTKPTYFTELCRPAELDSMPIAVQTVAPRHPGPSEGGAAGGKAVIEFIIDADGRPRMPVLVSSPDAAFAAQAARALVQWQFTRPTRNGRPVAVPARQEFVFPARS
jgi:TonB family protein